MGHLDSAAGNGNRGELFFDGLFGTFSGDVFAFTTKPAEAMLGAALALHAPRAEAITGKILTDRPSLEVNG